MHGRRTIFPTTPDGPVLFPSAISSEDDRQPVRSARCRRCDRLERENARLREQAEGLTERVATLETTVEFDRRHMEKMRKGEI